MGDSGIEWTDKTDNVIRGCSRTCSTGTNQSGCGDGSGGGCYAEAMAWRIVQMDRGRDISEGQGKYDGLVRMTANGPRWTGVVRLDNDDLLGLVRLRSHQKPHRRFINSMSDVFHENLPRPDLDRFWAALLINCRHEKGGAVTFQILTKRAALMRQYLADPATLPRVAREAGRLMEDGDGWHDSIAFNPLGLTDPRIWLGVSVENQAAADERIPDLLRTPAAVRFLSCEPLLASVRMREEWLLGRFIDCPDENRGDEVDPCAGCPAIPNSGATSGDYCGARRGPRIDQVIAGCESGPGARPCEVDWLRSLRDQCAAAEVPFFLKQAKETLLGVCGDSENPNGAKPCGKLVTAYVIDHDTAAYSCGCTAEGSELGAGVPLGEGEGSKRKPGGIIGAPYLDGVQHLAFPEVRR